MSFWQKSSHLSFINSITKQTKQLPWKNYYKYFCGLEPRENLQQSGCEKLKVCEASLVQDGYFHPSKLHYSQIIKARVTLCSLIKTVTRHFVYYCLKKRHQCNIKKSASRQLLDAAGLYAIVFNWGPKASFNCLHRWTCPVQYIYIHHAW